jgi:hypothetical protein
LSAHFNLNIKDCAAACRAINKIEALTTKFRLITARGVPANDVKSNIAISALPNLIVTTNQSAEFRQWYEDFIIKGNHGSDKEKSGTLEFLSPDRHEALFTSTFRGLGPFKLTPDGGGIRLEMYCGDIGFGYSQATF